MKKTRDVSRAGRLAAGIALAMLLMIATAVGALATTTDDGPGRTGETPAELADRAGTAKQGLQRTPRSTTTSSTTLAPPTTDPGRARGVPPTTTTSTSTTTTSPPTTTTTAPPAPEPTTTTTIPRRARTAPPTTTTTTTTQPPATTTTTTQPPTTTTTQPPAAGAPQYEQDFVARINDLRASVGLAPLQVDGGLTQYARDWSAHMAATGQFAHSDIGSLLGPWQTVGENIAWGYSVESMFNGLAGSPGHYANMTRSGFTHVGVGVVVDPSGRIWTTHVFAG